MFVEADPEEPLGGTTIVVREIVIDERIVEVPSHASLDEVLRCVGLIDQVEAVRQTFIERIAS